jgi:dihydroneopterin aldolase
MFKIEIKNLATKARIGISVKERKKFQPLLVTLQFDDIQHLKDYSAITKYLKFYIEHSIFKTLEKLVFECSQSMRKKLKLKNVHVSINKESVAKRYGCESLSVSQ